MKQVPPFNKWHTQELYNQISECMYLNILFTKVDIFSQEVPKGLLKSLNIVKVCFCFINRTLWLVETKVVLPLLVFMENDCATLLKLWFWILIDVSA